MDDKKDTVKNEGKDDDLEHPHGKTNHDTDEITHEDLELLNSNPDLPDIPQEIEGRDIFLEFLDKEEKPLIIAYPEVLLQAEKTNVISEHLKHESEAIAKIGSTKELPLPIREVTSEKFIDLINFMAYPYVGTEDQAKELYATVLKLKFDRYANHLRKELIDFNNLAFLDGKETKCSEYITDFKNNKIDLQKMFIEAMTNQHLRVANYCVKQDKKIEINILMNDTNIQYIMYHSCKYGLRSLLEYVFERELITKITNKRKQLKWRNFFKRMYLVAVRNDHLNILSYLRENARTSPSFDKLKLELLDIAYYYNSLRVFNYLLHEKDIATKQQLEKMLVHAKEKKLDHYIKILEERVKES